MLETALVNKPAAGAATHFQNRGEAGMLFFMAIWPPASLHIYI